MTIRAGKTRRRGATEGATAVEFAIVAAPLFFMIFAILELAMVFIASTTLENAMNAATRRVRTGEFQAANRTATPEELKTRFKAAVCANMSFLQTHCGGHLTVDVRPLAEFDDQGRPDPVKADGTFSDEGTGVTPGTEQQRVLATAFYRWPLATPMLGKAMAKLKDNEALLISTVTFQNEPFGE